MRRFLVMPWFETKVFGSDAAPETIRAVRRLVFAVWFLIVLTANVPFVRQFPTSLFTPVGFLRVFPERAHLFLLEPDTFATLKSGTLLALGLAVFFRRFELSAGLISCLALTLIEGIYRGFGGHVNHTNLALLYAAYFVTLFPLVDRVSGKQKGTPGAIYVAILGFMLLPYTMTGVFRLAHGHLGIFLNDTMTAWALQNSYSTGKGIWELGKLVLDHPWMGILLNLGFPVITVFEILAPLCLVSRPFRIAFLLVMVPFHVFSWLFLKIFFWHNLILFVLLLDFDAFVRRAHLPGRVKENS